MIMCNPLKSCPVPNDRQCSHLAGEHSLEQNRGFLAPHAQRKEDKGEKLKEISQKTEVPGGELPQTRKTLKEKFANALFAQI